VRLLLDTHIWIWSHVEPERLSPPVIAALEDPDNELWLSPISVWEFLLLVDRERIVLRDDPDEWLETAWSRSPMHDAALTREVARRSRTIKLAHQDPADRFIAATAAVYDLTLVTDDVQLLKGRGYAKLAVR
jgi:PIN domain nuclease of toxin-antitoxin system